MNIRSINSHVLLLLKQHLKPVVSKVPVSTSSTKVSVEGLVPKTRIPFKPPLGNNVIYCGCADTWRFQQVSIAGFHTTAGLRHGEYEWKDPQTEEEVVLVQIIDKEGNVNDVRGKIGDNLLYLAKRFEVEMEGACEASLACTTCHVYVDHEFLDLLPEATETEEDLLDQAPFLKENSRLGCQIILSKQLNGIKLSLPAATKNFYVDGHKPTPH